MPAPLTKRMDLGPGSPPEGTPEFFIHQESLIKGLVGWNARVRLVKLPLFALLLGAPLAAASLPVPTNLAADLVGDDVVLTWTGVPDATGYLVYRDGEIIGEASNTTFTDQQASAVAIYWVTALLPGGESPPSNPVQSGPCAGPSLDPPFFYANPENCWDYVWETIDDITH